MAELLLEHNQLMADQGRDINVLSTLLDESAPNSAVRPATPFTLDDVPGAEMAVYAPSEVPPSSPERAEFEAEAAEDAISFAAERVDAVADTLGNGKRKKTEYTAREWAMSPHFLAYMKRGEFKNWPVEKQNTTRDAFVAKYDNAPPQNRWGRAFSRFCGVQ